MGGVVVKLVISRNIQTEGRKHEFYYKPNDITAANSTVPNTLNTLIPTNPSLIPSAPPEFEPPDTGGVGVATTLYGPSAYPVPHCLAAALAAGGYVTPNNRLVSFAYGAKISRSDDMQVEHDGAYVLTLAGAETVVVCLSVVMVVPVVPGMGVPRGRA